MANLYGRKVCNFTNFISLCKSAKVLLVHANRAVEIAIEQNEQAAIDWLESVS